MKIINEEIENLEITETTTVVNQPTGAAKEESKTLWDRFMQATEVPEDAPLFGAEDQPVPDEVEEIKVELDEGLFKKSGEMFLGENYTGAWETSVKYNDPVKQELAYFINDRIYDALDNIFIDAMSTIPELPEPEEYDNPYTDKRIASLVRELVAEYYGPSTNESLKEDYNWNNVYEVFTSLSSVYWPDEDKIHEEVEKIYRLHKGEPAWDEAWKRWAEPVNESLEDDVDFEEYVKEHPNFNKNFDRKKWGKYFDKNGELIPELKDEFMDLFLNRSLDEMDE